MCPSSAPANIKAISESNLPISYTNRTKSVLGESKRSRSVSMIKYLRCILSRDGDRETGRFKEFNVNGPLVAAVQRGGDRETGEIES